ncbi:MAG TPA: GreA/GreB family elongation factor [Parvularculaceae bacterium]|nr:GreA/GreB family elongation factor [Parvularculaceae bacterium]
MTQGAAETFKKPVIYVTDADYDVLSRLSDAGGGASAGAMLLADELDRAVRVRADHDDSFVKIGSHVKFRDISNGQVKDVQLVLPKDADINAGRISVLTPVGASLIGLTTNARFQWIGADKRTRELEILNIEDPKMVA